jgi:AP2-like factor, euAP2 lineage
MTKEELVQSLRRQSKGYHQNSSKYRGVTKHQKGKWEARIGQVVGKKYKYLGLFTSETDAAIAYDRAAVQAKRLNAQTNFDISSYMDLLCVPLPLQSAAWRPFSSEPVSSFQR